MTYLLLINKFYRPLAVDINNIGKIMKDVYAFEGNPKVKALKHSSLLFKYLIAPLISGIKGFIAFMLVIFFADLVGYCLGTYSDVSIEFEDVLLSAVGFLLEFIIGELKNFSRQN